ncbi:uncharacterized protein LOC120277380 [Dioscorea cayenensis subsp. rotundata]|uniref:Uncharacterized protein LOC120277380 n=1 Tax=Dioscorea cayennensis subsp. rotundata TaxID=55577 RepID=A0AB40CPQ8_DIOCR|nr:uncharacterized protein LOC120277380 [Dioscorea cayenensis subsp. rotundata]
MSTPRRRKKVQTLMISVQPLTPLMEGPDDPNKEEKQVKKKQSHDITSRKRMNNLKLMLGVLACPLSPVPLQAQQTSHFSIKDSPIESSSAGYIVHQYLAASGWLKAKKEVKSKYTAGSLNMVYNDSGTESGCFVLWQMSPEMWLVDMVIGKCKVVAGSNGGVVWRHMPWLGAHAARGPPRPLRRIIQGLDPKATARVFENARCIGEKRIGDEDCFVLKMAMNMGDGAMNTEVIRHVVYGYFSQRSGLIVYIEDTHLTRVQRFGLDTVYWETTIGSTIEDYREIDGILIAHQGRSVATVFRFGKSSGSESRIRMVEKWRIDDVVFDVPGLSIDCFIPPAEIMGVSKGL